MIDSKYFILILSIISISVFSQPTKNLKHLSANQSKKMAKSAEKYGDIYSAIDFYEKYCNSKTDDFDALYTLAELYRKSRDYSKAKKAYLSLYNAFPENYPKALYYVAQIQKSEGDYKNAKDNFEKFRKEHRIDDFKKLIKNDIEGCELAIELIENKVNSEITHLDTSINKAYIEFSPIPINDNKLIYASLKSDTLIYFNIENNSKPTRKFYTAELINNKWIGGKELQGPFNLENIHTGNGAFSQDGLRFYFTKCETDWQNKVKCSIWLSIKKNDEWLEPYKLEHGINDPLYSSTQPSVGKDSKKGYEILYFVSDRPDGKGGLDIWYAIHDIEKNLFKEPKNLGSKINTEGDELTPYYDQSKFTLYFSSNGWPNIGNLDIFSSTGEQTKWSKPTNLGFPLNSGYDDIYYVPTKNRKEAFFTSNRTGSIALKNPNCCDDIYSIKYLDLYLVKIQGLVYQINDEKSKIDDNFIMKNLADSSAVLLYVIDDEDNETLLASIDSTDISGEFNFELDRGKNYKIVATKDGYYNKQTTFSTKDIPKTKENFTIPSLGLKKISKKPMIIDNIYYEFSKATLTPEAMTTIDTTIFILLNETPEIIVEISSHTDSVSSEEFNIKLSQKRAESVVNYLIAKGIEKERLIAKGYGESQPIAPNSKPNGADNPEGRARNRRTEFKVIGSSNQYSILNREDIKVNPK